MPDYIKNHVQPILSIVFSTIFNALTGELYSKLNIMKVQQSTGSGRGGGFSFFNRFNDFRQ
jgi:hypothetical protein